MAVTLGKEPVHNIKAIAAILLACASGAGGYKNRCNRFVYLDSTGGIDGINIFGSAAEDGDHPKGVQEGETYFYYNVGLLFGGPISNRGSNIYLNRVPSTGFEISYQYDSTLTDPSACTFLNGRSLLSKNLYHWGAFHYIPATGPTPSAAAPVYAGPAPYPPNGSPSPGYVAAYHHDSPLLKSWQNPEMLGAAAVKSVRCHFRYCTSGGAPSLYISGLSLFPLQAAGVPLHFVNDTAGVFVHKSLLMPAATVSLQRRLILADYSNQLGSTGPALVVGFQFTDGAIDENDDTTGPGGFSVSVPHTRIGQCITDTNADMAFAGPAAVAETLAEGFMCAYWIIIEIHMAANDLTTSRSSFKPTDQGCVDARVFAFVNGTWDNAAKTLTIAGVDAGRVVGSIIKVNAGTGWTVGAYKVSSVATNVIGLTNVDGSAINVAGSANVGLAAEPAFASGADQSTPLGGVQNIATFMQLHYDAMALHLPGISPTRLKFVFSGCHPQDSGPVAAGLRALYQGVCDWVDGKPGYSTVGYKNNKSLTVVQLDRLTSPQVMRKMLAYNGPIMAITNISATNPPVITTAVNHGLSNGAYVQLFNTRETSTGQVKLSQTSLAGSAPPHGWQITYVAANQFSVANGGVAVADVTGLGSVRQQTDNSHLSPPGQMYVGGLIPAAEFTAAGVQVSISQSSISDGSTSVSTNKNREAEQVFSPIIAGTTVPALASAFVNVTFPDSGNVSGRGAQNAIAVAVAALSGNYRFVDFFEAGDTRPDGFDFTAYVPANDPVGDTPHTMYGVRIGPNGQSIVLDKLCDGVLTFNPTTGQTYISQLGVGGAVPTSSSATPTDELTSRNGDAQANTTLPAGIRVYVPPIYCGVVVASGLGTVSKLALSATRFFK